MFDVSEFEITSRPIVLFCETLRTRTVAHCQVRVHIEQIGSTQISVTCHLTLVHALYLLYLRATLARDGTSRRHSKKSIISRYIPLLCDVLSTTPTPDNTPVP